MSAGGRDRVGGVPEWLTRIGPSVESALPEWFAECTPPPDPRRTSAVLILVAESDGRARRAHANGEPSDLAGSAGLGDLDVVLTERAHGLRSHAAQVSFPGGHIDPTDTGPVDAALREAHEEVGLRPKTVEIVDRLPALYMHPWGNAVTPVIGWWRDPHPIGVVDSSEVARVVRVRVADLIDPGNRFTVTGTHGYHGPGFSVENLFVWGFTAKLLDALFVLGGVAQPWDDRIVRPLPDTQIQSRLATRG